MSEHPLTGGETCPAMSPESRTQCALPDDILWHPFGGHSSALVRSSSVAWGATREDVERWGRSTGDFTPEEKEQARANHQRFRDWDTTRHLEALEAKWLAEQAQHPTPGARYAQS